MLTNANIDFFHFLVFQGALCVTEHEPVGQIAFRAPFTKLSHIALFFCTRIQIGMDFGIKRGGMKSNFDW